MNTFRVTVITAAGDRVKLPPFLVRNASQVEASLDALYPDRRLTVCMCITPGRQSRRLHA